MRLSTYANERMLFNQFCFGTKLFPMCEFEHPDLVEKLVGPYKIAEPTCYDSNGEKVFWRRTWPVCGHC